MDVESEFEGVLLKQLYQEWDACEVLKPVAVIGEAGEQIDTALLEEASDGETQSDATQEQEESKPEKVSKQNEVETKPGSQNENRGKASPRAKAQAERQGIDIGKISQGSGPQGRVIERDVFAYRSEAEEYTSEAETVLQTTDRPGKLTEATAYEAVPFNRVRKIISDNMVHSLQSTAQLTLNSSFDATQLLDYRKKLKATEDAQMVSISINDMILFAVSKALQEEPTLNSHIVDDELRIFKQVNLGFACDTDKGLMVPTIEASNKKTLMEVSKEAKDLIKDCQSGKIDPSKLQGATFTVTNLGSLQIESFTPIINPPQSAILGVGSIDYKIKKEEGDYRYYPAMSLSLTIDHRGIDGAPGARFMKHLIKQLEQFELLLAK